MARPTIQQVRALGDFATQVHWDVSFSKQPAVVAINSDGFNLRCESTDVPRASGSSTEVWIRGHRVKQPGVYTPSGTLTLTLIETIDNFTSEILRLWREGCWETGTGRQRLTADCIGDMLLRRLNRQNEPIWQYTVYNVYLEDYDPTGGNLQNQSADLIRPTLTISYDYFVDAGI